MKPFPQTPAFQSAAKRIVWFENPAESLASPIRLLAYAMRSATAEDMALLLAHVGVQGLREALDAAPPGIVDARSWAYWQIMAGRDDPPEPPARSLAE